MNLDFSQVTAILGLLLIGAATLSGVSSRSVLSVTVLSLAAGVLLAAFGAVEIEPDSEWLVVLIELVLLLTLFTDGMTVESELVKKHWHPAARALVIAMPLNAAMLGLVAKLLFGEITWAEALLIGFALSPTDPVVTSSVVASPKVPRGVRHTLNLESGLNDGLALPFVLFFLVLSTGEGGVGSAVGELTLETVLGVVIGGALAFAAGKALDRLPEAAFNHRYEALYALGLGSACYGVTELLHGNGLIGAFVGGGALAFARHEVPEVFLRFNENLSTVLQVIAFAVFGALIVAIGFGGSTLALIAFIFLAIVVIRPLSVLISFIGIDLAPPEKLFIAWFGPKGVASMLFALLILDSTAPDRTLVFEIAAFTIIASIVVHGLTDTVGSHWIERQLGGAVEDDENDEEAYDEREEAVRSTV